MKPRNVLGIIVEYNPLHNGHVYHFRESRKISGADAVVAVMSGSFLQRGEPALVNKWARAQMAITMGADLVIELPVAYSVQPAQWFAFGAVSALESTGIVNCLAFGSESGSIDWMKQIARRLHREPDTFRSELKKRLATGAPYPSAYSDAVAAVMAADDPDVNAENLRQPNNTLGLHYLIALERLQSRIRPLTVHRVKSHYNETHIRDTGIASATAIRKRLLEQKQLHAVKNFVPDYVLDILREEIEAGRAPMHWDRYMDLLLHQIICMSHSELRNMFEVSEGLEYRITRQLSQMPDEPICFEQLVQALKSKRYTRTKLQRTLTRILLQHSRQMLSKSRLRAGVPYLRVLGMSQTGRKLLKAMKQTATVPVVQQPARHKSDWLELDIRASAVYALGYSRHHSGEWFRDYTQSPFISNDSK